MNTQTQPTEHTYSNATPSNKDISPVEHTSTDPSNKDMTSATPPKNAKPAVKKASKSTNVPKEKTMTAKTEKAPKAPAHIVLADICDQLKIDPKLARRKLRKANLASVSEDRWEFTPKVATQVRDLLKGNKAK